MMLWMLKMLIMMIVWVLNDDALYVKDGKDTDDSVGVE